MNIRVFVNYKKNVLDPQGAAVGRAMTSIGFATSSKVRVGKTVEFSVDGKDTPEFRKALDKLCVDLLSNPVIEDYRYEITQ